MPSERKRTFHVCRDRNGVYDVWDSEPGEGYQVERTIEAGSHLAAYVLAFGALPNLDPGIRDLVVLLDEIPGIETSSSCEGHERAGDPNACVALTFDNLTAVEHFGDLVTTFVTSDDAYMDLENPPALDLRLELCLASHFREGEPIPCVLLLGRFPMDQTDRPRPPGAKALRAFAAELRKRAAARFPAAVALTPPPTPRAASVPGDEIAQWLFTAPG